MPRTSCVPERPSLCGPTRRRSTTSWRTARLAARSSRRSQRSTTRSPASGSTAAGAATTTKRTSKFSAVRVTWPRRPSNDPKGSSSDLLQAQLRREMAHEGRRVPRDGAHVTAHRRRAHACPRPQPEGQGRRAVRDDAVQVVKLPPGFAWPEPTADADKKLWTKGQVFVMRGGPADRCTYRLWPHPYGPPISAATDYRSVGPGSAVSGWDELQLSDGSTYRRPSGVDPYMKRPGKANKKRTNVPFMEYVDEASSASPALRAA
jgi:hypothetical protein